MVQKKWDVRADAVKRMLGEVYKRNPKGQFIETNGNAHYRRAQLNGIHSNLARIKWIKAYGPIPTGYIVHHIDGDKKNDTLSNLKLITHKEHNQIHAHPAWNKGKKAPQISKAMMGHPVSDRQIIKCKATWKAKYIDSMEEIAGYKESGLTYERIARIMQLTYWTVLQRHLKYKRVYAERG